jgi:hypothetical protein
MHDVRFVPEADIVSGIRVGKKPASVTPEGFPATYQIDQAACFRFLHLPGKPDAPQPLAKQTEQPKLFLCFAFRALLSAFRVAARDTRIFSVARHFASLRAKLSARFLLCECGN